MPIGELHCLRSGLWAHHGFRTLWWDRTRDQVVHTEPDDEMDECEDLVYVATLMRPSIEELAEAVARVTSLVASENNKNATAPLGTAAFA